MGCVVPHRVSSADSSSSSAPVAADNEAVSNKLNEMESSLAGVFEVLKQKEDQYKDTIKAVMNNCDQAVDSMIAKCEVSIKSVEARCNAKIAHIRLGRDASMRAVEIKHDRELAAIKDVIQGMEARYEKKMGSMWATIEQQGRVIESQGKVIASLQKKVEELSETVTQQCKEIHTLNEQVSLQSVRINQHQAHVAQVKDWFRQLDELNETCKGKMHFM